jgi:alpha-L-fucosidase 2
MTGRLGSHDGAGLIAPWKKEGLKFEARIKVTTEGGSILPGDNKLRIEKADSVTLLYTAATSYVNYRDIGGDPGAMCNKYLSPAASKTYEELSNAHRVDYGELFNRVRIDLGGHDNACLPTDQRLEAVRSGASDPLLAAQCFQFGRYLLIASSRTGTQPANLQGIWNNDMHPSWGSKWTLNINTEMNYWPAEVCNLAECHEPLFRMIDDLRETGGRTAKVHYNCRGFVVHHNTDLWRGAAPVDRSGTGMWPMGGAWLTRHLWDHYDFGRDKGFLRLAYVVIKDAALFFVDYLVDEPYESIPKGARPRLVTCPAISFEQAFAISGGKSGKLCMGPTMDMQIIRDLFSNCIKAGQILGVDEEFRRQLALLRNILVPTRINPNTGRICEWRDYRQPYSNRTGQIAQLWGLYPGEEITPWSTPELAAAARRTLEHRGLDLLGSWMSGTRINFAARLADGELAYGVLRGHIKGHVMESLLSNLQKDLFQADGNFGVTAGIAEMLLQSHGGRITLLPALPAAWPEGRVEGLRARGAFEVDISWSGGELAEATIKSLKGNACRLFYRDKSFEVVTKPGGVYRLDGKLRLISGAT